MSDPNYDCAHKPKCVNEKHHVSRFYSEPRPVKRDSLGQAFCNGFVDRVEHGLLRKEQLYRRTWLHRSAWRAGWEIANCLTSKPLRTAAKLKVRAA